MKNELATGGLVGPSALPELEHPASFVIPTRKAVPMTGTEWIVERVVKVTDGDTVRLVRSRLINLDGRHYTITDADTATGVPIRLVWVDTPERGDVLWSDARQDLIWWVQAHPHLNVVCYESGGWDRIMGDLICQQTGQSASEWLMTSGNNGKGWPAYVKGQ